MSQMSTGSGRLQIIPDFPSRHLHNQRPLRVYLPPNYDDQVLGRYPVLYLQDGQNLFDPTTAAFGVAWEVQAKADRLIGAGQIPHLIMVGLDNTPARMDEYSLYRDPKEKVGGCGREYAHFVVEEVKPFIDQEFRTLTGPDSTGIAGSSLGGLVALTTAWQRPDVFGLCGIMSPSLWWSRGRVLRELKKDHQWMKRVRFWLDMGTHEGDQGTPYPAGIARTRQLARLFDEIGLVPGRDYAYREVAGGEHNEAAWAARFDQVLIFLFGTRAWDQGRDRQNSLPSSTRPALLGVLETALHVEDVQKSREFFTGLFADLKVMVEDERLCALAVAGRQVLLLFRRGKTHQPVPTPGGVIPPHGGEGQLHMAFAVAKDDLESWEKKLAERGITVESKVTWPRGGVSLYFRDLDNHLIELATPGIWPIW